MQADRKRRFCVTAFVTAQWHVHFPNGSGRRPAGLPCGSGRSPTPPSWLMASALTDRTGQGTTQEAYDGRGCQWVEIGVLRQIGAASPTTTLSHGGRQRSMRCATACRAPPLIPRCAGSWTSRSALTSRRRFDGGICDGAGVERPVPEGELRHDPRRAKEVARAARHAQELRLPADPAPAWFLALYAGAGKRPRITVQYVLRVLAGEEIMRAGLPLHGLGVRRDPIDLLPSSGHFVLEAWLTNALRCHFGSRPGLSRIAARASRRWQR